MPPGCEFCDPIVIHGIRSGYTGGVYGVDADGDGIRDGSLTAELEIVSEVSQTSDGDYLYTWELRNLGTGAVIAVLGSGPDFSISSDDPLLGIAGSDRLIGTHDDRLVGQIANQTFIGGSPAISPMSGITVNPSTGPGAMLYVPALNPPLLAITIDIKPNGFPNSIKPKLPGKIPVALLTSATFDATDVDPTTVRFGISGIEANPVHFALEDVDGDSQLDLILHFASEATGIACGHTTAVLTAKTFSGQRIQGFDSILTAGCK